MVRFSTIIAVLMMIFIINPLKAQRLLEGQKAVELSLGIPFKKMEQNDKNYSMSLALTSNTKSGDYWRFAGCYNRKTMTYKQRDVPYDLYQIEAGYFLQTLTNYRRNFMIYTGLSALGGYEVFNRNKTLLEDGATLKNKSQFVYGANGMILLDMYLTNSLVIGGFAKTKYVFASDLNPIQSEFGVHTRIFIN